MNALMLLRESALMFRHYEDLHRAKGTEDGFKKAERNATMAAKIEVYLKHIQRFTLPIEYDAPIDRVYIPLPGGWEVQTKGSGSSFRICDTKTGERQLVPDFGPLHDFIERMAREVHAEVHIDDDHRLVPDDALLKQALSALQHHTEQTRPIEQTDVTIALLQRRLNKE